jgi:hypothetical protein
VLTLILALLAPADLPKLVQASFLTDRIVLLQFDEGKVRYHGKGQKRSDEEVFITPLDVDRASKRSSYSLTSSSDRNYRQAKQPVDVGRKSKGHHFAWFSDEWAGDRAVNKRPDHTKQHFLYLFLPTPARPNSTYKLQASGLVAQPVQLRFDPAKHVSDLVKVNLLGYVPDAPQKFAYVFGWLGDKGGLDLKPYAGAAFRVLNEATGKAVLTGTMRLRKAADNAETFHAKETPNANFLGADVYECDISALKTPGRYRVSVQGIGSSHPFAIGQDVYRTPFRAVARALYHNRSGIELKKPFTEFVRPAPHHPTLTPGFAGKLQYSTLRYLDYGSESGTLEQIKPTLKGPLNAWGWYQDAGDWDSYSSHLRVPQELLLAYELAPGNFADGELNIPESGNGIPDIVDEAAWLPRFCHRLRQELLAKKYGTGGIGLRVAPDIYGGDPDGVPSYEDPRPWVASGEDPVSTYGYAGTAAQLALTLKRVGKADPQGVDWTKEAIESYRWAKANTLAKDEPTPELRTRRLYAAASLFRLTGEKAYEDDFRTTFAMLNDLAWLGDNMYGVHVYALGDAAGQDAELRKSVLDRVRSTAESGLESRDRRALRWSGIWSFPMLIGHQTTPWVLETAVAAKLFPDRRERYRAALYTTCDYFLGGNSLNIVWITGIHPRSVENVFHLDAWYNGRPTLHPGVVPYGPWRTDKGWGNGPWDYEWANKSLYPTIEKWPGNERWFNSRYGVLNAEFTVHQNLAPAAAIYGVLCGPRR